MDGATHVLIPYAAALVALGSWRADAPAHRIHYAVVFGVAGWAPDADGLTDWLARAVPELYFLVHRGASHSLVGAPVFAVAVVGVLALLARRFPRRLQHFTWRRGTVWAVVLGSWTHIVLDGVTYAGVPAFWPVADGRILFPAYHWLVLWLFPPGLVLLALHAFWKLDRRGIVVAGAAFAVVLAAIAGIQLANRPDVPDGGLVFTRPALDEWTVLTPGGEGRWRAALWRDGSPTNVTVFATDVPDDPGAAAAVERAASTPEYAGFRLGAFGPETLTVTPLPAGGWNVTFTAVAQAFDAQTGTRWTPAKPKESWGVQSFEVAADGRVVETHRGW